MFKKRTTKYSLKTLGLISSFVLIYSTTGILLTEQIRAFTDTPKTILVKDETFEIPEIVDGITSEDTIAPLPQEEETPTIKTHTVASGDTLSSIAKKYSISVNTVRWANDISPKENIKVGQVLTILPVTGIQHKIQKGDTLGGIAKKYEADQEEILSYNDIASPKLLRVGTTIIIPNGEFALAHKQAPQKNTPTKKVEEGVQQPPIKKVQEKEDVAPTSVTTTKTNQVLTEDTQQSETLPPPQNTTTTNYFTHPVPGSVLTQGLHGYNSVDFGAPKGTPILAAAGGIVIIEKGANRWYGGYGNYIVIEHDNGTQTLYSHNSKNLVSVGDKVTKGQTIALVGSTGRSTGNHLHFEVRGGKNPWVGDSKGTKY